MRKFAKRLDAWPLASADAVEDMKIHFRSQKPQADRRYRIPSGEAPKGESH